MRGRFDADHRVGLGAKPFDRIGRSDGDGHDNPISARVPDLSETRRRRRAGRDAVVNEEHGFSAQVERRPIAAIPFDLLSYGLALAFDLRVEIRVRDTQIVE